MASLKVVLSFFVFLVAVSSVLCLSLTKVNDTQKIGLPMFMYKSKIDIESIRGVADLLQIFLHRFKKIFNDYMHSLWKSNEGETTEAKTDMEPENDDEEEKPDQEETNDAETSKEESNSNKPDTIKKVQEPETKPDNAKAIHNVKDKSSKGAIPSKNENSKSKVINEQEKVSELKKEIIKTQQDDKPKTVTPVEKVAKQSDTSINNKPGTNQQPKKQSNDNKNDLKKPLLTKQKANEKQVNTEKQHQPPAQVNAPLSNEVTKSAVQKLEAFLSSVDSSLDHYLQHHLIDTLKVVKALRKYAETFELALEQDCAVSKYEENLSEKADKLIEETISACVDSVPKTNKDPLKKEVEVAMAKIQDVENDLKVNSDLCSSLKEPQPELCRQAKKKVLEKLNNVISENELKKYRELSRTAALTAAKSVESCLEERTKNLVNELVTAINRINECALNGEVFDHKEL